MTHRLISRRAFLKTAGVATVGVGMAAGLAACQAPAAPAGDGEAAMGEVKELVTYWGSWTPTQSMERSEDNPLPHDKVLEVLDGYTEEHPDVSIEWIRAPQGISSREWTIAQQTAGTIPHIVTHAHWHIKDDLDKGWWTELTPYFNQPNPYIPSRRPRQREVGRPVLPDPDR